ncbi:hypothetical protein E4U54_000680 [Claviceps lovelessii]|nr:hypothetical protein E4U54_000680 [Claviceps lovelessii]
MVLLKTLLFLGAVSSQALAVEAPISGYSVVDLAWDIELAAGNDPVNFTGTVQQVQAQLKELNPRWAQDLVKKQPAAVGGHDDAHLLARDEPLKVYCSSLAEKWHYAETSHIKEGIEYLYGSSGKPKNGPGPGACARLSCSYRSAIWWCHDNNSEFELDGYKDVAYAASAIVEKCARGWQRAVVKGQAFMPGNWNVVVRHDMASC